MGYCLLIMIPMYIEAVPNRNSPPAILLREGWREGSIQQEAALDGIYVLRTSEPAERLSAQDTVRSYKSLSRWSGPFDA
jgi:hypothetical protein